MLIWVLPMNKKQLYSYISAMSELMPAEFYFGVDVFKRAYGGRDVLSRCAWICAHF